MSEVTETTEPTTTEPEKDEPKSLSQEDINKLIQAARKQEKDKLYETINSLKDQVTSLSEAQKQEKEAKEQVEREAQAKQDQERKAKLSVEDRMAEQLKVFEERLEKEAEARQKISNELEEERQKAELERYKHEVLSNAGDEIVRELVTGTTKAEIDHSVATAKTRYQDYFQAALKNAEGDPGRKLQAGVVPGMPKPADPDPDPIDEEGLRGLIPKVDPYQSGAGKVSDEYKKNRDEILSRVAQAYGKA